MAKSSVGKMFAYGIVFVIVAGMLLSIMFGFGPLGNVLYQAGPIGGGAVTSCTTATGTFASGACVDTTHKCINGNILVDTSCTTAPSNKCGTTATTTTLTYTLYNPLTYGTSFRTTTVYYDKYTPGQASWAPTQSSSDSTSLSLDCGSTYKLCVIPNNTQLAGKPLSSSVVSSIISGTTADMNAQITSDGCVMFTTTATTNSLVLGVYQTPTNLTFKIKDDTTSTFLKGSDGSTNYLPGIKTASLSSFPSSNGSAFFNDTTALASPYSITNSAKTLHIYVKANDTNMQFGTDGGYIIGFAFAANESSTWAEPILSSSKATFTRISLTGADANGLSADKQITYQYFYHANGVISNEMIIDLTIGPSVSGANVGGQSFWMTFWEAKKFTSSAPGTQGQVFTGLYKDNAPTYTPAVTGQSLMIGRGQEW